MEMNVSLSAPVDAGKQILFDMIRAGAVHDTGIESVSNIARYKYLGMSRGELRFVVAVIDDSIDEGGGAWYVLSMMTFDLKGGLEVSEGSITVTSSKKLDTAMASAKPSDFE